MKKLLTTIATALIFCVSLVCLFGCGDSSIEGKYMLSNAVGQEGGGMMTYLTDKDEEGKYVNVTNGLFVPDQFWAEIKGSTLTVHGSISPLGLGNTVKFNVNSENVHTIENFKLETSATNKNWYSIMDEKGEDTLWIVLKDGDSLVFKFGTPGQDDFWYNISYNKAE